MPRSPEMVACSMVPARLILAFARIAKTSSR